MKAKRLSSFLTVLAGACLMGLLWRLRGSHGWGSSWGVLAASFVFLLFLAAAPARKGDVSFPFLSLTAFSFMLTTPSWGTFLTALGGVQTLDAKGAETAAEVFVHPLSAAALLVCLGFGLAPIFGILTGKMFGGKTWHLSHFLVLLIVYYAAVLVAQATFSHPLMRWIQPECVRTFAEGLQAKGIESSVFRTYISHFASINWAKKIVGGRHYFAGIQAISRAFGAIAALVCTRFVLKDTAAAKTGAVVCGAFAFSITVSDLFFFFDAGGYHGAQAFSLPERVAPWSMWEYGTGFLAGGIMTAYLLQKAMTPDVRLPEKLPQKVQSLLGFVLFAAALGVNTVRPVLVRMDESRAQIPAAAAAGLAALLLCAILWKYRKKGFTPFPPKAFACALTVFFAAFFTALYLFAGDAEAQHLSMLHNALVLFSFLAVLLRGLTIRQNLQRAQ